MIAVNLLPWRDAEAKTLQHYLIRLSHSIIIASIACILIQLWLTHDIMQSIKQLQTMKRTTDIKEHTSLLPPQDTTRQPHTTIASIRAACLQSLFHASPVKPPCLTRLTLEKDVASISGNLSSLQNLSSTSLPNSLFQAFGSLHFDTLGKSTTHPDAHLAFTAHGKLAC